MTKEMFWLTRKRWSQNRMYVCMYMQCRGGFNEEECTSKKVGDSVAIEVQR